MPFLLCRHIRTNGLQCGSPAMKGQDFCYYHRTFRSRRAPRPDAPALTPELIGPTFDQDGRFTGMQAYPRGGYEAPPLDLGLLEDRTSIQVAISTVVNAIATNALDSRRASALLYGLQLASNNCPHIPAAEDPHPEDMLRESTPSPTGELLAPAGLLEGEQ